MKKKNCKVLVLLFSLIMVLILSVNVNAATKKKVAITAKNVSVTVGTKNKSLGVKVTSGAKVTYKSSAPSVVSVSSAGKVTAKKAGTAKIKIKATKKGYTSASKIITVKSVKKSQKITASDKLVYVGATNSVGAKATTTMIYKSSDTSIVTVNSEGVLTGEKAGTAYVMITAKATGTYNKASKEIKVTVEDLSLIPAEEPFSTSIRSISGGEFVKKGGKWQYKLKNGKYVSNGFYRISGKVYAFDKKGNRISGWKTINGKKYYFGKSTEGWMYCSKWVTYKSKLYYLNKNGVTSQGWKTINGKSYYFSKSGYALTGTKTIDGTKQYFDANGVLKYSGANLTVSADCAILIDASSGKEIYAKNAGMRHANGSTTKIMTCILALENCKLTEKVTASSYAASQEPTKLYLSEGETFYLKDLLYSLMLPSHNDTAVAIAEHVSGSTKKFVSLMNQKAKKLGCTNTHFATPNGLDRDLNHYTTARDIAKIAQYAYKNATFRKIINTRTYSFQNLSGRNYYVSTTNRLLGTMTGVCGMKTGFTKKAQHCFCGVIKGKNGKTYISVVLGAPTSENRWDDSRKLLQYAYNLK